MLEDIGLLTHVMKLFFEMTDTSDDEETQWNGNLNVIAPIICVVLSLTVLVVCIDVTSNQGCRTARAVVP